MFLYHDVTSGPYRNELWESKSLKSAAQVDSCPPESPDGSIETSSLRIRRVCKCGEAPGIWRQI